MNCIIVDDEELSRKVMANYVAKAKILDLLEDFRDPVEALSFISKNKVDLVFLDIEMPRMTGIDFIAALSGELPQVILTTSHKEFALDAYEHNVTDYLVKPVNYARFYKAVVKAKEIFDHRMHYDMEDENVFVKQGSSIIRVNISDILWVEALGDYVAVHTKEGRLVIHSTMKAMEDRLPSMQYVRVHRSFIVRVDKIDSIEDNAIAFESKLIPIGRSYREEVYKRLHII